MGDSAAGFDDATIAIGVLGRPHGVGGEITLRLFNDIGEPPEELESVILERGGKRQPRVVTSCRPCAAGLLIRLEGISSREEAATLTRSEVRIARAALPALEPEEYYVADLLGCRVEAEDGSVMGVVVETFWNGGQDVMVVRGEGGSAAEQLIPLVPDFVREVDVAARLVRVAWEPL
jgi:16S rRNA processing protein RimM